MLLRRLTRHINNQNWFAVWLDFFIVVVGVFIGIQVSNWNTARAEYRQETDALVELRNELEASIAATQAKVEAYMQATDAGKRSLAFIASDDDCAEACWDRLVDFMHASQWQNLEVDDSSYRNMRNQGFPTSLVLTGAVEKYLAQVRGNVTAFDDLPMYRSLVRQIVSIEAQEHYWETCWSLLDGVEEYVLDCPEGISPSVSKTIVYEIVNDPGIKRHLTEWVGAIVSLPQTLGDQNLAAQRAIDLIGEEIEKR